MSDYSYFCGIDLAKNHFSLHAVDQNGKVILHKSVTRSKLLTTIANIPLMRIGVEACGGAHYWVRTLNKLPVSWPLNTWFLIELKGRTTLMMLLLSAKLFSDHPLALCP